MKKIITTCIFALLFLSPSVLLAGEKPLIITIRIDKTTTQEDLDRHIEFMKANGYELVIEDVKFNEDGGVAAIKGTVDFVKSSGEFYNDSLGDHCIIIKKTLLGGMTINMNDCD